MIGTVMILLAAVGIPLALLGWHLVTTIRRHRDAAREVKVQASGRLVPADIIEVHDGATIVQRHHSRPTKDVQLLLMVCPPGEQPFRITAVARDVSSAQFVRAGQRLLVRYDAQNPSFVAVDLDSFQKLAWADDIAALEAEMQGDVDAILRREQEQPSLKQ